MCTNSLSELSTKLLLIYESTPDASKDGYVTSGLDENGSCIT